MKKLLTCLACMLFIFTSHVMAAPEGQITTQSIAAALEARNTSFQLKMRTLPVTANVKVAETLVNYDTYIDVINFTDYLLYTKFSNMDMVPITAQTSARYKRDSYTGVTRVTLFNPYQSVVWDNYVLYHDILSVYIRNGQYIVYVSHS